MALNQLRVVVFQEGGAWVAQALEHDIGAQGPDMNTLMRRFKMVIRAELEESLRRTGIPFGGIDAAPPYVQSMWKDDAPTFQLSGVVEADGSHPTRAEYEMRLAA